jgi:hypothetical protein
MKTIAYKLKIETYKYLEEPNYRIILVDSKDSFYKLHLYIQELY